MQSSLELFSLKGRTAVIIGGTGELCGAISEGFASAGAHVILVGRDPAKADARLAKIKSAGGKGNKILLRQCTTFGAYNACCHCIFEAKWGANCSNPFSNF